MTESRVQIVYTDPGGEGYHPVYYMARLASELLDGELVALSSRRATFAEKMSGVLSPRKNGKNACLLICPSPTDLNALLFLENWRKSHGKLVAWVFDSFWVDNVPRWAQYSRVFDHLFVTEHEDLHAWREKIHAPVDWLPWGSDVLRFGSQRADRQFELLRFGRQPKEWEDDEINLQRCKDSGLRFHGRPPSRDDPADNERTVMSFLSDTKFSLAFSNRVSQSIQTHSKREYITARWTDSLASGATVAGIPPRCEAARALLWPEALLDLGSVHQKEGLEVLVSATRQWTAERARINYLRSLESLDWRWRLKAISEALCLRAPRLYEELSRVRSILETSLSVGSLR